MKPSWKTGEYYLAIAAFIVSALLASGAFDCTGDACPQWINIVARILGGIGSVLTSLGYTVSRSNLKAKVAKDTP